VKLKFKFLIAFLVVSAFVLTWPLFGDVCRVQRVVSPVYSYSHQYAQPVVLKQVYQPYYYAVGTDLQLDAIAEKLSARIEQKLIERQRAMMPPQVKLISASCAKCHTAGTKAVNEDAAPVYFDPNGKLTATAEQRASMKTAVHLGVMPPGKELTDDEYLQFVKELKEQP
jgi:uncharacterized membrane protein